MYLDRATGRPHQDGKRNGMAPEASQPTLLSIMGWLP
jgi:hypothetical protein